MKPWSLVFILALVSGCGSGSDQVRACEAFAKDRLRSPSSYNLIKSSTSTDVSRIAGKTVQTVILEYDAQNGFGATIRGAESCYFEVDTNGRPVSDPAHAASMAGIASITEDVACCLLDDDGNVLKIDRLQAAIEATGVEAEEAAE